MNKPYVKQFDYNGELVNPIIGSYIHSEDNRRERRKFKNKKPFIGNGKSTPLTVVGIMKYKRVLQRQKAKDGSIHKIEHYLLT